MKNMTLYIPTVNSHTLIISISGFDNLQLNGLRGLVKGKLKKVERQVLSALIVIEVHARDVTNKLVKENVVNINDFEWISQLR